MSLVRHAIEEWGTSKSQQNRALPLLAADPNFCTNGEMYVSVDVLSYRAAKYRAPILLRGVPEVFHEAVDVVRLRQGDLEAHRPRNVARKASKALLTRSTDTDKEGRASRHFDEAVESQEMPQSVVEQHQLQLQRVIERGFVVRCSNGGTHDSVFGRRATGQTHQHFSDNTGRDS